jgi:hypothetical protein
MPLIELASFPQNKTSPSMYTTSGRDRQGRDEVTSKAHQEEKSKLPNHKRREKILTE